jgi:hypothetical protein
MNSCGLDGGSSTTIPSAAISKPRTSSGACRASFSAAARMRA